MAETTETAPPPYLLPAALRQALLAYLIGRPYHEVSEGVTALTNLKQADSTCACSALTTDA